MRSLRLRVRDLAILVAAVAVELALWRVSPALLGHVLLDLLLILLIVRTHLLPLIRYSRYRAPGWPDRSDFRRIALALLVCLVCLGADAAIFAQRAATMPRPSGGIGMAGAYFTYFSDGSLLDRWDGPWRGMRRSGEIIGFRPPTAYGLWRSWWPFLIPAGISIPFASAVLARSVRPLRAATPADSRPLLAGPSWLAILAALAILAHWTFVWTRRVRPIAKQTTVWLQWTTGAESLVGRVDGPPSALGSPWITALAIEWGPFAIAVALGLAAIGAALGWSMPLPRGCNVRCRPMRVDVDRFDGRLVDPSVARKFNPP